jgi:hypothetical protein
VPTPARAGSAGGRSAQEAAPMPADQIIVAELSAEDWPEAAGMYEAGIASGNATFEPLLGELIEASERAGFSTVEAGIFPENIASISLHERLGFRLVGMRRHVGQMPDGRWRDVLLYERRSLTVGYD